MLTTSYWARDEAEPVADLTVGELLCDAVAAAPDRTALVAGLPHADQRRRLTYTELLLESERAARALLGRFDPGERVAVWAPNVPEWIVLEMAAGLAGLVLVTVNPAFRAGELEYVLRQSRAAGIFSVPEFRQNPMASTLEQVRPGLEELREAISFADWDDFVASGSPQQPLPVVTPDDPVQIQYTSGTTGFPKGAVLCHRGVVNNARFTMQVMGLGEGEVWLSTVPMFHTGGSVVGALGSLWARAVHVPMLAFEPGLALDLIENERVDAMGGVPTMLIAMMEHPDFSTRDASSLRIVMAGGAPVPADLVHRLEAALGIRFVMAYGQTESSSSIAQGRADDSAEDKAETVGLPHPQQEVKVVDVATGEVVAPGAVGEICTRGYNVMLGYFEMPEATAEAIDADGWLHTGDLATMDERGYVRIVGRLKEMVIRGGENLFPREIEDVLFTHPAVAEAAVLGVPDERWGEELAAVVRRAPGHEDVTAAELRAFVRERLAAQKAPRVCAFVDRMPLTPSGKIQKFVLRERLLGGELETA
ncbi:MAG: AMP-binding protein [Acidimicrobiia bacterium]|nr:AMP-binding protein [Acidimicrobiia bacterium]